MLRRRPAAVAVVALTLSASACGTTIDTAGLPAEAARGAEILAQRGCLACHSVDGSRAAGPTFAGLWGSTRDLTDGSSVVVDEEYVAQAIRDPGSMMVVGAGGRMPAFDMSDADVAAVSAYLQELSGP